MRMIKLHPIDSFKNEMNQLIPIGPKIAKLRVFKSYLSRAGDRKLEAAKLYLWIANDLLLHAAKVGEAVHVKALILLKAKVNCKGDLTGNSPLHNACQVGSLEKVQILLDAGAKLDSRNKDKKTPLDLVRSQELIAFIFLRSIVQ